MGIGDWGLGTAGQERYMSLNQNLFLKVQGILLIYDITSRPSFNNLQKWMNLIRDIIDEIPLVLIGNKIDRDDEREVTYEEGEQFAKEMKITFFESSGKEDKNVKEAFYTLSEEIIKRIQFERTSFIQLNANNNQNEKKKRKCCSKK